MVAERRSLPRQIGIDVGIAGISFTGAQISLDIILQKEQKESCPIGRRHNSRSRIVCRESQAVVVCPVDRVFRVKLRIGSEKYGVPAGTEVFAKTVRHLVGAYRQGKLQCFAASEKIPGFGGNSDVL